MLWEEYQNQSFYESTARVRAFSIADKDSFRELIGPDNYVTSPHLPVLGAAVSFDDGVVTGVGKIGQRTVFVISQEGGFIGGSVGEAGGAKMVGIFRLALETYEKIKEKYPLEIEARAPAVIISFDTGGVRLQEANAGLLAHAEVMEQIQFCRGKVPVISLVGSKLGCFGGMGFICVAADAVIMSEMGRLGLTGPEVIEEVMGKKEFDSSDRALIYRTTGGKHKYIIGDISYLAEDFVGSFRQLLIHILNMPYEQIAAHRVIGSPALVREQLALTELAATLKAKDARDVWQYFGNSDPERIPEQAYDDFMDTVARRQRGTFI